VNALIALAKKGKAAYIDRWLGQRVTMIVERHNNAGNAYDAPDALSIQGAASFQSQRMASSSIIGTTENYLKAMIEITDNSMQNGTVYRWQHKARKTSICGAEDKAHIAGR